VAAVVLGVVGAVDVVGVLGVVGAALVVTVLVVEDPQAARSSNVASTSSRVMPV
jgi:hypothetical protein